MTKEEVLQRANDYCNERSYDKETLTDDFKENFATHFAKRYGEEVSIDEEDVLNSLKFSLDTAKSAAAKGITLKQKIFQSKESDYLKQIEELNKRDGKKTQVDETPKIPEEIQKKLEELERFKNTEAKKQKKQTVIDLAKTQVRQDLHKSFEAFTKDFDVLLEKEEKEQADGLVARFQEIFRDSIGEIKPLAPKAVQKRDEDFLSSLPKVKI